METRLERIAKVVEYCLDKMLTEPLPTYSNCIARYNRWMEELDNEIKRNMDVDTLNLKVSEFMRSVINNRIDRRRNPNLDWYTKRLRKRSYYDEVTIQ